MKKKVALITIRNEMKVMYYEELNSIFLDCIDLVPYSLEVDHKYQTDENTLKSVDIVLITNPDNFSRVKHMLREDCKIIHLNCAFLKNKIESLKNFPKNTKALVCFNYYEVSNQAAKTIYDMGVTNLDISVYNFERTTLDQQYDIAIVGESSALVPEKISTIVSLGRRKISLSSLMELAINANILDHRISHRILDYSKDLAQPSMVLDNIYAGSLYPSLQLQTIMDHIDYGIIILNNDFKVMNYNEKLEKIFNVSKEILNIHLHDIPELKGVSKHILHHQDAENVLIEVKKNQNIMLSTKKVNKGINASDFYIVFMKDVTDITNLENTLKRQLKKRGHVAKYSFSSIYGNSNEIKECIHKAKTIAKLDKTVLIIGESGTGKELFAQSIHNASPRKNFPFLGINCAALPSNLLESELFGYEEGTFTGGLKGGKVGLFEAANNGTLFLDEIGDMSLVTQAKILRVLEEKEFMRLGGNNVIAVNVRIIAATNVDLKALIKEGKFRLDLYYRLNTLMFKIPPLRKRKEDIKALIELFLSENNRDLSAVDKQVVEFLINHSWKGNVRELKNCIDYMVSIADGEIKMNCLPDYIVEEIDSNDTSPGEDLFYLFNTYEKEMIMSLMEAIADSGGGRRKMYQQLRQDYPDFSEYKLRKFIDLLVENNLVLVGEGRSGMRLSDSGVKFLKTKERSDKTRKFY